MSSQIRALLRPGSLLTTAVCAAAAFAVSVLSHGHAVKSAVPVTFLLALAPIALIAGRTVGLAVSLVATLIFAAYLYAPYGSLAIHSAVDRVELFCFALAAVAVVYFSPGPNRLANPPKFSGHGSSSTMSESGNIVDVADPLETWIAVVGYVVVFSVIVTLLLSVWN